MLLADSVQTYASTFTIADCMNGMQKKVAIQMFIFTSRIKGSSLELNAKLTLMGWKHPWHLKINIKLKHWEYWQFLLIGNSKTQDYFNIYQTEL